jgi:outer membrane protein TolC
MGEAPQVPADINLRDQGMPRGYLFPIAPRSGGPATSDSVGGFVPGMGAYSSGVGFIFLDRSRMGAGAPRPEELPDALPTGAPNISRIPAIGKLGTGRPLQLGEMLATLERRHPLYQVALLERRVAGGELLSAFGAFDTALNMDSRNYPLGFYDRYVHDVLIEQQFPTSGIKYFGGYRVASGDWPIYYNYLNTRGGGAFIGGLVIPLLQNNAIDPKRAKLAQSEIERQKVEPDILKQRITLVKEGSKAYWNWVAAGQSYAIMLDLVRVAEARNEAVSRQVKAGLVRPIDQVDFERILLSRQQQVTFARRRYQEAAIELSLYLRDAYGLPNIPPDETLPLEYPPAPRPETDEAAAVRDIQVALQLRPEILSVRLLRRKAMVDRELAQNQFLPSMNIYIYTEQNVGNYVQSLNKDFRPFIMESSLLFDVPLQRRFARGRIIAADGLIAQLGMQERFVSDRVAADVRNALINLNAQFELLERYRDGVKLNAQLEAAEEQYVNAGLGTILSLNLREQAVADAQVLRIDAEAKYFSALAEYRAALALDAIPASFAARNTLPETRADAQPLPNQPQPAQNRPPGPFQPGGPNAGLPQPPQN